MRVRRSVLFILAVALLGVGMIPVATAEVAPAVSGGPVPYVAQNSFERCFINEINAERSAAGLAPLTVDAELLPYLRAHANRMAQAGDISLMTTTQILEAVPGGSINPSQNVASWSPATSCSPMHDALMDDLEGSAIILDPAARFVGVGVVISGSWGWVAQVFYDHPIPFDDAIRSPFRDDIAAILDAGITQGCSANQYCPNDPVTRGQMAAFLARALSLPTGGTTPFSDIAGSGFADEIAAVYVAGITQGCNQEGDRYCPNDLVTRGQMAAFLNRALSLPTGGTTPFSDIAMSGFVPDISAVYSAGITQGCAADRYCPYAAVTRGQMAAFLNRALDLG